MCTALSAVGSRAHSIHFSLSLRVRSFVCRFGLCVFCCVLCKVRYGRDHFRSRVFRFVCAAIAVRLEISAVETLPRTNFVTCANPERDPVRKVVIAPVLEIARRNAWRPGCHDNTRPRDGYKCQRPSSGPAKRKCLKKCFECSVAVPGIVCLAFYGKFQVFCVCLCEFYDELKIEILDLTRICGDETKDELARKVSPGFLFFVDKLIMKRDRPNLPKIEGLIAYTVRPKSSPRPNLRMGTRKRASDHAL